jgi:hypothetical protein
MSDIAQVGLGTALKYQVGSGGFVSLANLVDLAPPDAEVKIAEYQPLTSPSTRQKLSASLNSGDCKFTLVHGAAMYQTLMGLRGANNLSFVVTFADGTTTQSFNGIIKKIGTPIKLDEVDMIDVEMAVSGDITHNP